MTIIIPASIMTALTLLYVLAPIFSKKKEQKKAMILGLIIALSAIGIYVWKGHSDIPSAPALFEKTGQRAELRQIIIFEQDLEIAHKSNPDNLKLSLTLADTKLKLGKIEEAVKLLEQTINKYPENTEVKEMLGSILFGMGMMLKSKGAPKEEIIRIWQKAKKIAPKGATYPTAIDRQMKLISE